MTREQIINDSDTALTVLGVPGRLTHRTVKPDRPNLWCRQRWISAARSVRGWGTGAQIRAEIRFDDECGNGHNTFAITATIRKPGTSDIEAGGCLHDEIAKYFPELAPLIKWHLTSSDGPMHYIANTLYHAGDRDCNGLRKGEKRQIVNGKSGKPAWIRNGTRTEYFDGDECPTDEAVAKWEPWMREGEGKKRELDHARSSAVWPEATDAELMVEPAELRAVLEARHPQLMADFRAAMEGAGLKWDVETLAPMPG